MGLLQKAVETYDAHAHLAGVMREGHLPLAPISHSITSADVEITLDEQGKMVSVAEVPKDDAKTIIPVTEESAGRTSGARAHPLCDQVKYLSGIDKEKTDLYLSQLEEWESSLYSHPMLKPILTYVKRGTLWEDLSANRAKKTKEDDFVRWRVIGLGEDSGPCWTNKKLFQSYIDWYDWKRSASCGKPVLCMITGEVGMPAIQHPKGIIPIWGNAKLISTNDKSNYTYLGRFTDDIQAATVSYHASQKAHNALRWLAAEQGKEVVFGKRTFLCWNPKGVPVLHPTVPFLQRKVWRNANPTEYGEALLNTLRGYRNQLPDGSGGVVIAAFDASTKGRLALTYFNELRESDFLQRLYDWDKVCCWWTELQGSPFQVVASPPLSLIVSCAFGTQRKSMTGSYYLRMDDKLLRQQIQRLFACRVDKARFPFDIKDALVYRASNPQCYRREIYEKILSTACAVIRKYHFDRYEEEISMALDRNSKDRSYQYGRLLAVMEQVERTTYNRDETREPNAIQLQYVFCRNPLKTAATLQKQLDAAYFPRIKKVEYRKYLRNLMEEIFVAIDSIGESVAAPLKESYLIGYYLQRNELLHKVKKNEQEEEK